MTDITWFYNFWIVIGTLSISLVAFAEQVSIKTKIDALNHLWFKFLIVLCSSILIGWATIQKDSDLNQIATEDKANLQNHIDHIDSTSRNEKKKNDSILNLKIDSAKNVTIEALAKYNLILIDSLKQVTSSINAKAIPFSELAIASVDNGNPPIYLNTINNVTTLNLKFETSQNTAYKINIDCFIIQNLKNQDVLIAKRKIFNDESLVTGRVSTRVFNVPNSIFTTDTAFIIIKGYFYPDYKQSRKQIFKQFCVLNTWHNKYFFDNSISWDYIDKKISRLQIPLAKTLP